MSSGTPGNRGWPHELRFLLERHPRSRWPTSTSLSAAFWLDVHARLRRDCAGLDSGGDEHRAGRTPAGQLAAVAGARLRGFVIALHGHHQIEDFEYFPAFRRTEPKLAVGFDRLEADHRELAHAVERAESALAELRASVERSAAFHEIAVERYLAAAAELSERVRSHLRDEEDLVVPLLIEHGEV